MAKKSLSLAELLAELNRHRKKLPALRKQADALRAKLAAVEAEISTLEGAHSPAAAKRAGGAPKAKRPRNKTNLGEAIVAVLSKDKPMSIAEIVAAVQKNGYRTTSRNFSTIVHQAIMTEKKRIARAERGLYILKG